jgi:hypothetical protein
VVRSLALSLHHSLLTTHLTIIIIHLPPSLSLSRATTRDTCLPVWNTTIHTTYSTLPTSHTSHSHTPASASPPTAHTPRLSASRRRRWIDHLGVSCLGIAPSVPIQTPSPHLALTLSPFPSPHSPPNTILLLAYLLASLLCFALVEPDRPDYSCDKSKSALPATLLCSRSPLNNIGTSTYSTLQVTFHSVFCLLARSVLDLTS